MSTDSSGETPSLEVVGAVATVTLRRPAQANRIGLDDLAVLGAHLDAVGSMQDVRVLCLRSTGTTFCAGFDLKAIESAPDGVDAFAEFADRLEATRPITIAVIEGGVFGGATDLCLACDFRIGTTATTACMPAARLGIVLYEGALRRYLSRLGIDSAKRMLLAAAALDGEALKTVGFLTDVVAVESTDTFVRDLVDRLVTMAPLASLSMKQHLNRLAAGDFLAAHLERDIARARRSSDAKEGVRAWRERRVAAFTGT